MVRISPAGLALKKYTIPRDAAATGIEALTWDLRLSEKTEYLYVGNRGKNQIRAIGFDGQQKWKAQIDISGGWDVDDAGVLWAASWSSDVIQKYGPDGKPGEPLKLTASIAGEGDFKSALQKFPITSMRVFGNEVFIKRRHPTEMFLRFDATTGALEQPIASDYETFTVQYPGEIWTAGQRCGLFYRAYRPDTSCHTTVARLGARHDTPDYHEWEIQNGKLQVPAGAAGIYQIKVTPEVQPILRGTPSEYLLQSWIEVRAPDSKGTANVFTADNRAQFARGENVPFAVLLRGVKELEGKAVPVVVQLRDEATRFWPN